MRYLKFVSLLLACCVAFLMLALPGFAANDDPYDGDSYLDIPTGTNEDPYNQNGEDPVVESAAPDTGAVENPDPVVSEEVTDDTQTSPEEELPAADDDATGDPSGTDDTGTSDVPVVQVVDSSQTVVYDAVAPDSSSRSALLDAVISLFGNYQPRTYTVTTYLEDGSTVQSQEFVSGLAGLDYEWIAGAGLFIMALYCIFRTIGGMMKWK